METLTADKQLTPTELLPSKGHPNYDLWANYAQFARDRGELVTDLIAITTPLENLSILDIGCGEGGTSMALAARGANVTAMDFNEKRVQKLRKQVEAVNASITVQAGDAHRLNFANPTFDWVILQDVIEHLPNPEKAIQEVSRVLKPAGHLYLSTPNRWSPLNFVSDPHWNLPLVSVLSRKGVEFFICKLTRREKCVRDFAALLSLFKLKNILRKNDLQFKFINRKIADALFSKPTSVVNSKLHLKAVTLLKKFKLQKGFNCLVNEKFGLFNYFLNPTWYLIAQKSYYIA